MDLANRSPVLNMDADAAKTARESLDLAFQMSNALAAVVKELRREPVPLPPSDAARPVL
ncbi:mitotic-spindle organizing protein 1B-like [Pyrus ussuriensis x Pyrus communis]|uniref:Mitotic-spindle organizing protein 1B-like n=1 Tax=Pyrus ussuriensis x Pyrus communis TaxID=2448454 RepID=A0A5N5GI60_9ROSA|nr:mitotic-spindle organizing protein 1B-like [Pyrus ussuriensis x Pyrus communis]